jgi:predicted  nucleic acid-binding Zn-ribbon protein
MKSHNVLALLFSSLSVIGVVDTHAQSPADVVSAMRLTNTYIAGDVTEITRRCDVQARRKTFLEAEILRRQPQLETLTASRTELQTQLTAAGTVVTGKRDALATLEAEITGLRTSIVNANTSATTLLATYRAERDAATVASARAARDIQALDRVFEEWKESGSNEFTLMRAIVRAENGNTPTAAEQAALDRLNAYDTMRAQLSSVMATNDAIVTQKNTAIAELTAGRTRTVQEMQAQLNQKLGMVPAVLAQRDASVREYRRIDAQIRGVSARISTLSSIVIPAIHPVCQVITVSNPQ